MKRTLFNTPILTPALRWLARRMLRRAGWRVEGRLPDIPKYIIVGAPHTSNWDFVLFLGVALHLQIEARYMAKAELFRPPFGWFFYWCGGVPVDRKRSTGLVDQMADAFRRAERMILVITPEGTRHHVTEWKRGFYYIARTADVPVVLGKVDGKRKVVSMGEVFPVSGDEEADMAAIRRAFAGLEGINPKRKRKKKYITLEE